MRPRILLMAAAFCLLSFLAPTSVHSVDRSEEALRKYFENEPALLKIHIPMDKKGVNYYPFRKTKKLDYVGRDISIFKGSTATIYRVKVMGDYIEVQFNEGGGSTVGRVLSGTDWPFEGKNYGGRINVRFEREVTAEDLNVAHIASLLSPLFCLVKDYDKNCYAEALPDKPAPEVDEPRRLLPLIQILASPPAIRRGECAILSWKSSNAEKVDISNIGAVQLSGNQEVCPENNICYEATATNAAGVSTDRACVDVGGAAPIMDTDFSRGVRDVFFAFDRSTLTRESQDTLRSNIAWLQQHPQVRFVVEGHCDERGTTEYNIGLGMRRAQAVRDFLIRNGIPGDRFTVVSYGEERPFATCHNESCWSQNRRGHFAQQ